MGEVAEVQNGYAFKSKDFSDQGMYVIKIKNVASGKITLKDIGFYNGDTLKLGNFIITKGDILVSMTGSHISQISSAVGKVAIYNLDKKALLNQRVGNIKTKSSINKKYLSYLLIQPCVQLFWGSKAGGSANQANISPSIIESYKFSLPPLPEQRAIAAVLSSFDDKLELLREQNKTLEETAQRIFREWFVDFNFPDEGGKAYKKSDGKMVESELGEIPEGWRGFRLEEIVETINGYSYKGSELVDASKSALVTLKSFDRNGGFQTRGFKPFTGEPKKNQEVFIGDLVVAHTDLTQDAEVLGNPAFIFENGYFEKMYITMDLIKVISQKKEVDNSFLYYLMKTRNFKRHCVGYANGTTVLHLSKKAVPEYQVALPINFNLVKQFSMFATIFTQKISYNNSQIQTLSTLRDELLPRLMRGEVRVKH